jgi:ketosteroid isomerase-like protein
MKAATPEEICELFRDATAKGDMDAAVALYDADAVFVTAEGDVIEDIRQALGPIMGADFTYVVRRVAIAGDTALMHTEWRMTTPAPQHLHAIEVARRQGDGSWRWLIGDPFTVGKTNALEP